MDQPVDLLAQLPDTYAGRHTRWLWSRMLAIAAGSPPIEAEEVVEHFAPEVIEHVPVEQLIDHWVQLAGAMAQVHRLVEEANSSHRYSALLGTSDVWMRYTCAVQVDDPHRVVSAYWSPALDPSRYVDRRVRRKGRDVQIRDFGGAGPLMLLWHGAGMDLASWEMLVPLLAGFHVVAQDLPAHGRSPLPGFTTEDTLADADAVVAELGDGPPIVVGHSLGGYMGLRYASTRNCAGWIGLDGPLGLVYLWDVDGDGFTESTRPLGRAMSAIDVAGSFAAIDCPAMLLLAANAASELDQPVAAGRRQLAAHLARHHPSVRVEWTAASHDTMLLVQTEETARAIGEFLRRARGR